MKKDILKNIFNIKNIINLIFILMFFNVIFIGYQLYFNCFNWIYLIFNLTILLLYIFKNINKKIDLISNLILLSLLIILFIVFYEEFINGFKICANNIFSKSQSLTNYKYTYYQIDLMLSKQQKALMIYVTLISFLYSLISFNLTRILKGYLLLLLNVPLLVLSIYFDVGFNMIIVILLIILNVTFIILNTYLHSKSFNKESKKVKGKNIALLLSFSIIFSGSISLVSLSYNSSTQINNIANNIRDYFSDVKNEKDSNKNNNSTNDDGSKDNIDKDKNDDKKDEGGKKTSNLPILLIVLGIIFAILLIVPIILIIIENYKNRKYLKSLNSSDKKILIKTNYLESIKILRKLGVSYQNKGYIDYIEDLKTFNENYKKIYENATNLYLKTSYSDNIITDDDIKLIKEFYSLTCVELKKRSSSFKKIYWRMINKYEN